MRLAASLVAPVIVTSMMVAAYLIVATFENQVSLATQEAVAAQMPFMSMPTNGNLVLSMGSFLLATLVADAAILVPLLLLTRHDRGAPREPGRLDEHQESQTREPP
jgi:hypothetical protein